MVGELLGKEVKAAGYAERVGVLAQQLQGWAARTPSQRPTFNELVADGSFLPLGQILSKTVPFITAVCDAFEATPEGAVRIRDAVVLASVAGDRCGRDPAAPDMTRDTALTPFPRAPGTPTSAPMSCTLSAMEGWKAAAWIPRRAAPAPPLTPGLSSSRA